MDKYFSQLGPEHAQIIGSTGVTINLEEKGFGNTVDRDLIYPYIILTLCREGSARSLYDKKEVFADKNTLSIIMPGHFLRPLEYSEDYMQAWIILNPKKFEDSELKFNPKDLALFNQAPIIHLTDEQVAHLLAIVRVIEYINARTEEELSNKHRMLEMQLTVAYDLYLSFRRKQDQEWEKDRIGHVYLMFCDLVAAHYKQERNVNYYAEVLGYDPRYFSKIFRAYNNGISPLEWIQNYVCTHAKRIMHDTPKQSVKQTAHQLGFATSGHFCRYFKRATGMTPNEYREKSAQ